MSKDRTRIEIEKLKALLAEGLDDLLLENWEAVEADGTMPYAPDWERAFYLERRGIVKFITARVDGVLVGYNPFHVDTHIHSKSTLHAFNDVLWLAPEARAFYVGVRLVKGSEAILRNLGVKKIYYAGKVHLPRTGALLEKLGYRHVESIYAKVL